MIGWWKVKSLKQKWALTHILVTTYVNEICRWLENTAAWDDIELGVWANGYRPDIRCFAHTLNLAIKKSLAVPTTKDSGVLQEKHNSCRYTQTEAEAVMHLEISEHRLIIDVDIRRNSSFDVVRRYLDQQPSIALALVSPSTRKDHKDIDTLTDNNIYNAGRVMKVLKPLKTMTTGMCEEKYPT